MAIASTIPDETAELGFEKGIRTPIRFHSVRAEAIDGDLAMGKADLFQIQRSKHGRKSAPIAGQRRGTNIRRQTGESIEPIRCMAQAGTRRQFKIK